MKKGITATVLAITVAVMSILVTTATVVGTKAIQTAAYEEFMSKIVRVMNDVNEYVLKYNELPTKTEIVAKEGLSYNLLNTVKEQGDAYNTLYVIDMNKLGTESVNIGHGTVEDLDVFLVAENTNNVYYLKGIKYREKEYYSFEITVDEEMPQSWRENVIDIVNGVPIPRGFVASKAKGESTKANGLVIYEGSQEVNDSNVEWARRNRNQYVWVPVDSEQFVTQFIRRNYTKDVGESQTNISNTLGTDQFWEVALNTETNIPLDVQDERYITSTTIAEAKAMYNSVKKYGGFFIARYEAGLDSQRTSVGTAETLPRGEAVHSKMNKIPYTYIPWTWNAAINQDVNGVVEVARSIYPNASSNTTGVVSTLTYSVQWDTVINWWTQTNAVASVLNSIEYGNYLNHEITAGDLNEGAKYAINNSTDNSLGLYQDANENSSKDSETGWALSTGALKAAKVNNIYDMAGNMMEWSMEGYTALAHMSRGGNYIVLGNSSTVGCRGYAAMNYYSNNYGFRVCLYIK